MNQEEIIPATPDTIVEQGSPEPTQEAAPQLEQTVAQVQQDQQASTQDSVERENSKSVNIRRLRESKERAERERDELIRRLESIEAQQKQSQVPQENIPEDYSIAPDDLVEGKHLSKYDREISALKKQLQSYQQQTSATAIEAKLHSQFSDFQNVVNADNVAMLRELHPEIAQSISANTDLYSKAVSTYKLIKQLGIVPQNTYDQERARAHQNATKPRPLASVSTQQGDGALSRANAFANGLTDELKKQLHKEMIEAMNRG